MLGKSLQKEFFQLEVSALLLLPLPQLCFLLCLSSFNRFSLNEVAMTSQVISMPEAFRKDLYAFVLGISLAPVLVIEMGEYLKAWE